MGYQSSELGVYSICIMKFFTHYVVLVVASACFDAHAFDPTLLGNHDTDDALFNVLELGEGQGVVQQAADFVASGIKSVESGFQSLETSLEGLDLGKLGKIWDVDDSTSENQPIDDPMAVLRAEASHHKNSRASQKW